MSFSLPLTLASAGIGALVGLTGAGGGALMTPMLILFFSVKPSSAISSDLVATLFMRPIGGAVHWRRGTVNFELVGWLALGSVPAAFAGAYLLHVFGGTAGAQVLVERLLGGALLLGAAGMLARQVLRPRRATGMGAPSASDGSLRRLATVAIGALGGVVVGATSVGSGSLMIVLLLWAYPGLAASSLVGTDLVQAIPLTAAAALGQLLFGHVALAVTSSLVLGSVPGVLVGSLLSSRAPDRLVRGGVTVAIVAAGLKYVGLPDIALLIGAGAVALAVVALAFSNRGAVAVKGDPEAARLDEPAPSPG